MNEAQQIERVNSNKKRWNGEADEKNTRKLDFLSGQGFCAADESRSLFSALGTSIDLSRYYSQI